MDSTVLQSYQTKKDQSQAKLSAINKQSELFIILRPLTFMAMVALSLVYSFLSDNPIYLVGIGILAVIFVIMLIKHRRIKAQVAYWEALVQINEQAISRLEGSWTVFPNTGERFIDLEHPYSSDLNIFGKASLFQYINSATTLVGEERLAQMLNSPAPLDEIKQRQEALGELSSLFDWRQHFQAMGMLDYLKKDGDAKALLDWAEEKPSINKPYILWVRFMPLLTIALALLGYWGVLPSFLWSVPLAIQIAVIVVTGKDSQEEFTKTGNMVGALKRYSTLLTCIEEEEFRGGLLNDLQKKLVQKGVVPSQQIKQLFNIVEMSDLRYSSMHPIINIALLWDLQTLIRMQNWRVSSGCHLRAWVRSLAEFEALSSLAGLMYDHPHWAVAEVTDGEASLKAEDLGHPLIREENRVSNNVELSSPGAVLLITGSNMSGKSTLLRTVGINIVLACAGAPVCATMFKCAWLKVYSSIHINDNLEKNISNFYAELLRIKIIMDAAKIGEPMIFLIDEIFKGTNSKDRILGAQSVVKNLHRLRAIGLVSTHDLELSRLEQGLPLVKNYHFTDQIKGNEIAFDYQLKPGVSQSTNALALMKIIGIEVD